MSNNEQWLLVEYATIDNSTHFTTLPESALLNWQGQLNPARLLATVQKYADALGELVPTVIGAYQRVPESTAKDFFNAVTLCWLIETHDLTFSYSDDYRYYASGQASLDRIHRLVREQPWLTWHFYRMWNIKVSGSVTPAVENQWLLTPAQVAAIAGDPALAEIIVGDDAP